MIIKNDTKLTGEEVFNTLLINTKKTYYFRFIFMVFIAIAGIVIIGINISKGTSDLIISGSLFIVFAVLFGIMNVISIIKLPKTIRKQNSSIVENGLTNHFIFKEESFLLISSFNDKNNKIEARYENLKKIENYEKEILFKISSEEVIVCKKDGFEDEKSLNQFFYGLSKHKIKIKDKIKKD